MTTWPGKGVIAGQPTHLHFLHKQNNPIPGTLSLKPQPPRLTLNLKALLPPKPKESKT